MIFALILLGVNCIETAVMGAVSPAVVVPRMVRLIEEKTVRKKAYRK